MPSVAAAHYNYFRLSIAALARPARALATPAIDKGTILAAVRRFHDSFDVLDAGAMLLARQGDRSAAVATFRLAPGARQFPGDTEGPGQGGASGAEADAGGSRPQAAGGAGRPYVSKGFVFST